MENGPSNYNCEEKQIWERPWTLEEMRKNSANWSLAADSGLFLFLQDFSQRMLSKTHEIEKQLDGLIRDTKATDSCLHTVFNDFLMLSNTQFIENRVYDEEVEDHPAKPEAPEKQPELEKTREQKEAELIPKVQEAVNYGLQVLDSAFEQLDIKAGNSDSEDEEATDRVEPILEPKDLYVDRPLPYLIGSQLFMETDDVGLGDLSSEEMSIDSDRDSIAESEEGKDRDQQQSDEDFDQEEDGQGSIKKKSSILSYDEDEEEDEDSDIFGESDKEEDSEGKASAGPSSFADELAARIKGEPTNKPEPARAASSSISSITKKKSKGNKPARPQVEEEEEDDEIFKPPKLEDDDFSPFGGKGGLFSGGKGLFDDDDEGDLFSDAPRQEPEGRGQSSAATTESVKSKKIPSSAVPVFPANSLFGSPNDSDSVESQENGDSLKPKPPPMQKRATGSGGLFDEEDEEEDDDFFSGKTLKKPSPKQENPKSKKAVDLFGGEDGDEADMFREGSSGAPAHPRKREPPEDGENKAQVPEKKMPAGAVSMFGPGTKSLLVEGLRKRQPSTSEESDKSETEPPVDIKAAATKPLEKKAQSRGLFSDDEDSQIFPSMTKSQSKPEPTTQAKLSKAAPTIFDDEDEEDLFSSAPKPKSIQPETGTKQGSKLGPSSLFSDDEDQWMGSTAAPVKTGGIKTSVSAPSSLPTAKATQKVSLFDDSGDDLFAATKESSQKKPQRVSLMFEDETEDDEKDSLFGFMPANTTTVPSAKVAAVDPAPPSLPAGITPDEKIPAPVPERAPEEKTKAGALLQSPPSLPQEADEAKRKPAGAVSLFGGIDVLGEKPEFLKPSKGLLEDDDDDGEDDDFLSKDGPPPLVKSGQKVTLSLFDEDYDEADEEEANGGPPVSVSTKTVTKNTLKEPRSGTKSTGVFQDEELLFSQTEQKDNDPDVDLFATSVKSASPLPASVKPVVPSLFGDEDEDDLFASAKPKAPPKVAEKPAKPQKEESSVKPVSAKTSTQNEQPAKPVEPKGPTSRIGKLQASLVINPSSLLPGAVPRIPGAVSVLPGLVPSAAAPCSSSISPTTPLPSPASTPTQPPAPTELGVSFDSPAHISTLQSANKGRTKGAVRRRPQTRSARHQAAQNTEEPKGESPGENSSMGAGPSPATATPLPTPSPSSPTLPTPTPSPGTSSSLPNPTPTPSSPPLSSVLSQPATTPLEKDSTQAVRPKRPPVTALADEGEDLFGSGHLFAPIPKLTPSPKLKTKTPVEVPVSAPMKDPAPSIFDDQGGDLFGAGKQKSAKKGKAVPFLVEEDDDDLFGISKSIGKTSASKDLNAGGASANQDIFQDTIETTPNVSKKLKEKSLDASLFDDNVDIFADLTPKPKPKEKKSKKKVETKSIFDDDMDDIFSPGTPKPAAKPPSKAKKAQPALDPIATEDSSSSIFDDPLNVLGGN